MLSPYRKQKMELFLALYTILSIHHIRLVVELYSKRLQHFSEPLVFAAKLETEPDKLDNYWPSQCGQKSEFWIKRSPKYSPDIWENQHMNYRDIDVYTVKLMCLGCRSYKSHIHFHYRPFHRQLTPAQWKGRWIDQFDQKKRWLNGLTLLMFLFSMP